MESRGWSKLDELRSPNPKGKKKRVINNFLLAKAKQNITKAIPDETIIRKIYVLRGEKVMLDMDLAELYGVETKVLKQSVKRNSERFPKDFMFTLTQKEFQNLRS